VIGRSATRTYRGRAPREVARETGAGVILTGSVRPAGDTVKVSLELVDPADDTAIWSSQFTRELKDIFAVQAQVAEEVAVALRVRLQPTPSSARAASRSVDPRAYETYMRARAAMNARDLAVAQKLYRDAIAADAGLAEAFAGLAEALHLQEGLSGDLDAKVAAERRTSAERAYQLDPDLPQANIAMGLASPALADALRYMRHAVEIDPSNGDAYHQIADQISDFDPERATELYRKSLALDPTLEMGHVDIAFLLLLEQRPEEARRELLTIRSPTLRPVADSQRAYLDLDQHRFEEALREFEADAGLHDSPVAWSFYIRGLRTAGRSQDAFREASRALARFPAVCQIVSVAAGLRLERGKAGEARALAAPLLQAVDDANAPPPAGRCAVLAAAAIKDPARVAVVLDRVASNERWLRYLKRWISGSTGTIELQGRLYPFSEVVKDPRVVAAKQRLDAAYAREREVARSVLTGLP
jgi:hypothetical protein